MFQNCGWLCYPLWTCIFDLHGALFELFRSHGLEREYNVQGSRFVKWLPLSCETGDAHTCLPLCGLESSCRCTSREFWFILATGGLKNEADYRLEKKKRRTAMTLVSAEALTAEVTISETSERVELLLTIQGGPRPGKQRVGSSATVARIYYCICRCCTKNKRGLVQPLSWGGVWWESCVCLESPWLAFTIIPHRRKRAV